MAAQIPKSLLFPTETKEDDETMKSEIAASKHTNIILPLTTTGIDITTANKMLMGFDKEMYTSNWFDLTERENEIIKMNKIGWKSVDEWTDVSSTKRAKAKPKDSKKKNNTSK